MAKLMGVAALLVTAMAGLAAVPAAAQPPQGDAQSVSVPAPDPGAIRGRIQLCEAARGEHRVRLEAGRRYAISATSAEFDPYLRLLRPGTEEVLAEDDDGGGGVTPRLSFSPPQTADYVVRVSSAGSGGAGDYALSVTPQAPLPGLVTRPNRVERGQTQLFQGELSDASPAEFGRRFADYELRLAAGERVLIHVEGEGGIDTILQLYRAADRGNRPLAENDDGGGEKNPFIFFAPEQAGTYVVRVIGLDEQTRGRYRLRISR